MEDRFEKAKIHLLQVLTTTCYDERASGFCHYHDQNVKDAFSFLEEEGIMIAQDYQQEPYWYDVADEWKQYVWMYQEG